MYLHKETGLYTLKESDLAPNSRRGVESFNPNGRKVLEGAAKEATDLTNSKRNAWECMKRHDPNNFSALSTANVKLAMVYLAQQVGMCHSHKWKVEPFMICLQTAYESGLEHKLDYSSHHHPHDAPFSVLSRYKTMVADPRSRKPEKNVFMDDGYVQNLYAKPKEA